MTPEDHAAVWQLVAQAMLPRNAQDRDTARLFRALSTFANEVSIAYATAPSEASPAPQRGRMLARRGLGHGTPAARGLSKEPRGSEGSD